MKPFVLVSLILFAVAGCNQQKTSTSSSQQSNVSQMVEADTHNARNALDWNGIYKGSIPCVDCAGTELLIELKHDGSYMLNRSYTDKVSTTVMEEGIIIWNAAGNTIQIANYHFFVGENRLILLDHNNKRLKDSNSKDYALLKQIQN